MVSLSPAAMDSHLLMDDDPSSHRKANKPLMEKRRRARINRSLMELKAILVESLKKTTPGHSKWEKADILEMTVQYLQCLKNQQQATKSDPLSVGQFIAGFSECIRQIQKFNVEGQPDSDRAFTPAVQQQLIDFLLSYLKSFSDDATKGLRSASPQASPKTLQQISPTPSRSKSRQDSGFLTSSPVSHHSPTSSSLSPKSPAMSPGTCSNGSSIIDSPTKSESSDLSVAIPKPTPIASRKCSKNVCTTSGPSLKLENELNSNGAVNKSHGFSPSCLTLFMPPTSANSNSSSIRSQAFHPYSATNSTQGHKSSSLLQQWQGPPPVTMLHGTPGFGFPYSLMPGDHKDFGGMGSVWRPW